MRKMWITFYFEKMQTKKKSIYSSFLFLVPRVRIELTTPASSEAELDYIITPQNRLRSRGLGAGVGVLLGLTH